MASVIGEAAGNTTKDKARVRCNTLGSLFSASAQDLRSLDFGKEIPDRNSPRGVLEVCAKTGESEAVSPRTDSALCMPSRPHAWRRLVKLWKKKSVLKRLSSFNPVPIPKVSGKKSVSSREDVAAHLKPHIGANLCKIKASWKIFSLSELKKATNNFSEENMIGRGGFAEVYKGCLKEGELVAVKRLTRGTHEERVTSFLSELGIIAHVDHPNTAKLVGCGVEGGMHIVLELSSLGSLASLLYGSSIKLGWGTRYKIAIGTADGLLYLHEGCQRRIIHRDIKAHNILLTEDYDPQICDFGLAKWLPKQWTHHNVSKFEGTFGYFAPEYFMHGIVDEKTDVYSFGVLLLELITGRRALDGSNQSIVTWAKPLLDNNDLQSIADPCLCNGYDEEELDRLVLTASMCVQQSPVLRPRMSQVVVLLRGDKYDGRSEKAKQGASLRRTYSEELLDAKEYNMTRQLNELRRHRQLALACNGD